MWEGLIISLIGRLTNTQALDIVDALCAKIGYIDVKNRADYYHSLHP